MILRFMQKAAKNVDAYIKAAPKESRDKLIQIRNIIKSVAPKADERISYGMPYYDYKGRLAYFAAFKKHVSLFVPPPVIEEYAHELEGYKTAKATIHFLIDEPLPITLIKKMVKARIKKNTTKGKK
jgi:uncharacterized protein YdhG (YjbR/CyaY superfamily)